jgi:Stress responsive A/B Barrel Domain
LIRHIITWKLVAQDPSERTDAFDRLAGEFGALPGLIPEIVDLQITRDVEDTEGNWDVVLIVDYASKADLEVYQTHPEHVRVKAIAATLVNARAAIDFEV